MMCLFLPECALHTFNPYNLVSFSNQISFCFVLLWRNLFILKGIKYIFRQHLRVLHAKWSKQYFSAWAARAVVSPARAAVDPARAALRSRTCLLGRTKTPKIALLPHVWPQPRTCGSTSRTCGHDSRTCGDSALPVRNLLLNSIFLGVFSRL